jgi:hypothetical protein
MLYKASNLISPFRGDTLFGHTLTKPSQVKGLERVISACICYEKDSSFHGSIGIIYTRHDSDVTSPPHFR